MTAADDLSADMPDGGDAALALDFALGTLDGAAFRAAELRLRRDPAFAADVARWQADLAPLAADIAPVAAPDAVWRSVEAELFRTPVAAPRASPAAAVATWWRTLALGMTTAAAVLLAVLAGRPAAPLVPAPLATTSGGLLAAAMAQPAGKAVLITATYDPTRGAVILTPAAADASAGRTPELWVIPTGRAPISLGVIDLHGAQAHVVPVALRRDLTGGATLAITLEPAGGSPTGQPTGPIIAAGALAAI